MSRKRRNHSPEFKSKVALAAIKGDQTLSELSRQYGINSNLIVKWKKLLIEQSSEVFASGKGLAPDRESEIQSLQAKIGQLTMENDFFIQSARSLDRARIKDMIEKNHSLPRTRRCELLSNASGINGDQADNSAFSSAAVSLY